MVTEKQSVDLTIRPATQQDLMAIWQLVQQCEIELYGRPEMTLDEIRRFWQSPNFQPEKDAWSVLTSDGELIASAAVNVIEKVRFDLHVNVHPKYMRRGIGSLLVRKAEERVRELIPFAPLDLRITLHAKADRLDIGSQRVLEKQGFLHVRDFWRMMIQLDQVPAVPSWPAGITVCTMAPGMEHAVYEADEEAFLDHWGHIPASFELWKSWVLTSEFFDPSLWFLAMDGNKIAGLALCADEKEGGSWVNVLGVRRPWRRKGLGLALLQHAFGEFYRRGLRQVFLGVDAQSLTGATRLYEHVGMQVVRQTYSYVKELREGRDPSTQVLSV